MRRAAASRLARASLFRRIAAFVAVVALVALAYGCTTERTLSLDAQAADPAQWSDVEVQLVRPVPLVRRGEPSSAAHEPLGVTVAVGTVQDLTRDSLVMRPVAVTTRFGVLPMRDPAAVLRVARADVRRVTQSALAPLRTTALALGIVLAAAVAGLLVLRAGLRRPLPY